MFGFIKRYRAKKEQERKIADERQGLQKKQAENEIETFKANMLSKYCPINNQEKCFIDCVHFVDGNVFYLNSFQPGFSGKWMRTLPVCRLWRSH